MRCSAPTRRPRARSTTRRVNVSSTPRIPWGPRAHSSGAPSPPGKKGRMSMHVNSHDGARIYAKVEGDSDAPAILLSNSLGTRLEMWDWQMPAVLKHFQVVRYDSRGHGRSDAPEGPYAIDSLARDALAVLDVFGVRRAHVLGLSKGGMIGQWLGANAPEVVDRLILANTAAFLPPRELWDQRIEATRQGMQALEQTILERWFTPGFLGSHPEDVDKVRRMI